MWSIGDTRYCYCLRSQHNGLGCSSSKHCVQNDTWLVVKIERWNYFECKHRRVATWFDLEDRETMGWKIGCASRFEPWIWTRGTMNKNNSRCKRRIDGIETEMKVERKRRCWFILVEIEVPLSLLLSFSPFSLHSVLVLYSCLSVLLQLFAESYSYRCLIEAARREIEKIRHFESPVLVSIESVDSYHFPGWI